MITYIATPDYYRDYISHHGILGMHWGKRNGPPYPLGDGDHSASEKKAGWKKSLGSGKIVKKKTNKNQEYNQKVKKLKDQTNFGVTEEAKNNLNKRWDYANESYDDYNNRMIQAYDAYSKVFSNETKKAEKELDLAIKDTMPKDGINSSTIEKYSGIAALLSPYYDKNNFEDTLGQMWFYKYEDGDQGSDNSAMAQLVSNYGYEDAKKRINKYLISERNLEESLTNDFGKDEAIKLMEAKRTKDAIKTNYHNYSLRDGEIASSKKQYDEAMKKAKLLNDVVTPYYKVESAAKQVANKIKSARKSGLTYEEIADKYGVSNWFISDVLNNY